MADPFRRVREELAAWLAADGRTQALLAESVAVSQQTISKLLREQRPSRDLAKLIDVETGVGWGGWFTQAELEEFARIDAADAALRRRRARKAA